MTTETLPLNDVYSRITNKIIAELEKGQLTWRKPWSSKHLSQNVVRPLRWNAVPYTGINILLLWGSAAENNYSSQYWMTYNQALSMEANVRKGEKATQIVFADKITKEEQNDKGEQEEKQIPFLKSYSVFNASQIEGLPEKFYSVPTSPDANSENRIERLEQFFANTKAEIYTGRKACYYSNSDKIEMPPFESFTEISNYYSVLGHELTHWTKHPSRLDRDMGRKKYGDEGYAKEELVAELGACFLAADLGIEPELREDHSAYIQNWLSVLQNDNRLIFSAASQAQKAVEYIHRLQNK